MFTPEVIDQLQYYVYRLIDPRNGQTFYIGKGKGNRIYAHVNNALGSYEGFDYHKNEEDEVSSKIQQIREIKSASLEVIHVIQRYGLTEKEAFEVEAALIDSFPGLTNIQNGHSCDRGVNHAETIQRDFSYQTFEDVENLKYVLIKTTEAHVFECDGNFYEAIRKCWKVNYSRIKNIPYVLGVVNGVVRNVYRVISWDMSQTVVGRVEFTGDIAEDEVTELFLNMRIPNKYMKKGMASPVLYHD